MKLLVIAAALLIFMACPQASEAYELKLAGGYEISLPDDFSIHENGMYMDKSRACAISYTAAPRLSETETLEEAGKRTRSSFWQTRHMGTERLGGHDAYVTEMHHGHDSGFTYIIITESHIHMLCMAFKNSSAYGKQFCDGIIKTLKKQKGDNNGKIF